MPDDPKELREEFDSLFGKGTPRSDAEYDAVMKEANERFNSESEAAFKREKERRAEYLHMDQRIRTIASGEVKNVIYFAFAAIAVWRVQVDYGWVAGAGVALVAIMFSWWNEKQQEKRPSWKIEEIDDLAEDTITQRLIVEMEQAGLPWLWPEGEFVHWGGLFDYPYWKRVSEQVRAYSRMTHKVRVADNRAARQASLPYRLAMQHELKKRGEDWDLPYWAWLDFEERKAGR